MNKTLATIVVCLALLIAIPAMADVTVGLPPDPGSGNCFPWGCAYNAEYQQVYAQGQFSGTITIAGLEFYNTQVNNGSTSLPTGNWAISLSTTSYDVNTITGNWAANEGADNTAVWSGNINQAWTFGDTLTITFTTPFTYNPANGNLLMDVVGSGVSAPGGGTFFDVNSGGVTTRVFCYSGVASNPGNPNTGYGLVTTFIAGTSTTPEPGTFMLLGSGVLGLAGMLRRKMNL